jgi:TetR/AcrR family transcriptional regulator
MSPDDHGGTGTRERLIQEAVRRFGKAGYEGASLDAVASAAGVRKQTLLYYFPTKEALFESCVGEVSAKVGNALAEALAAQESESEKAETVIRAVFRMAEEWPEFPQFIREAGRMSPEVITRFAAGLEPLRQRALAFLDRGMSDGQIRRQDPALLLFTLYTAVVGSLTEAGVLRAVVGEDSSRTALRRREQEVLAFVRSAMAPAEGAEVRRSSKEPEPERAKR